MLSRAAINHLLWGPPRRTWLRTTEPDLRQQNLGLSVETIQQFQEM